MINRKANTLDTKKNEYFSTLWSK